MKTFKKNIKYFVGKGIIDKSDLSEKKDISLKKAIKLVKKTNYSLNELINKDIAKAEKINEEFDFKFLVCDIDGVLTDGGMYYTQAGDEFKRFNTKDGMAIKNLVKDGYKVGFLSSGINATIIENRAKLLGVEFVYVGTWKKPEILQKWCDELQISLKNVAYIGDDINDLEVIKQVGLSACPSDAVAEIKKEADIILTRKGGDACLREFVDEWVL
ncbi:MAG: HAD-IIIA family hydrolase [Bacteroidales bacterium]|nr:HAD-IIIA family hydrolase [Bacteroidales bacterium]